METVNKEK